MRPLNRIILHCTATKEGAPCTVGTIREWHLKRKFSDIGYHYVIYADGSVNIGRPLDIAGSHSKGQNHDSVGVAYVGGLNREGKPCDTMTVNQEIAFMTVVNSLRALFGDMSVHGHNEYSRKACPSFDVQKKFGFLNNTKN